MNDISDVAIVGAGPYGLSLSATLSSYDLKHRIFGVPMQSWAEHMPRGMHLKSEGFASSLYDPSGQHSLKNYCRELKLPYEEIGWPVPLATFVEYGRTFQRRLVPHLEETDVTSIEREGALFLLTLANGERTRARRVVLATGIRFFEYLPSLLRELPAEFVSHTFDHAELGKFAGKSIAVLGGGASALGFAALAAEAGADVQVFVRDRAVQIFEPPQAKRPLRQRLRAPWTGLGPGWKSWACVHFPLLFHRLPQDLRLKFVRKHLGPSGNWTIKKTIEERVPVHSGLSLQQASVQDGKLHLGFAAENGLRQVTVDHLVAGTGYKPDLDRLSFIDADLRAKIKRQPDGSPDLSSHFEASLNGIYFAGVAAAANFGPVFRFVFGVDFASERIARHLRRTRLIPRS
jgi:cation diffusion facilitator CzcD-associated flavoprotein CzcO